MSLLDHVTLIVSDFARSKAFYEKALAPLGVKCIMEFGKAAGFGRDKKPDFWIGEGPTSFQTPEQVKIVTPTHIAFSARTRDEVDEFYTPGWRPAAVISANRASARSITRITTARSCWTPTATTSRP